MQQTFIDFLKTRRSVTAKKMTRGKVSEEHLKQILEVGIRVPDHGALKPWKLSVITGLRQKQLDEEVIFTEFMRKNPDASTESQLIEKTRLQRADAVIAVISSLCPPDGPRRPIPPTGGGQGTVYKSIACLRWPIELLVALGEQPVGRATPSGAVGPQWIDR